jgi:hypothetical protein
MTRGEVKTAELVLYSFNYLSKNDIGKGNQELEKRLDQKELT